MSTLQIWIEDLARRDSGEYRFYTIVCPNCGSNSNISPVSFPNIAYVDRYNLREVGVVYSCDSCHGPVFVSFAVQSVNLGHNFVTVLDSTFKIINRVVEPFDFQHIPEAVELGFTEALECYSIGAYNGFAAMCRRTVQSICADLGTSGTDRVIKQVSELKDVAQLDDEIFDTLKQIVIAGHDGAHPHLPEVDKGRAGVLLILMKDVLHELYIRKGQLQSAQQLRQNAIETKSP